MEKRIMNIIRLNSIASIAVIAMILSLLITLPGCDVDNADNDENGLINVKLRTWNTYAVNAARKASVDSYNLDLIDVRAYKYEMKFTTDDIQAGISDSDIDWITVYTSNAMMLDSERDFQFELPVGEYKGFALLQDNDLFWVGSDGSNTIEIPDTNGGGDGTVYNVFGLDGLYVLDSGGLLEKVSNAEKIGTSFTITADAEHSLIVRMNFDKIAWDDNDNSGTWSAGDGFESPTLPDGIDTMADFIFE